MAVLAAVATLWWLNGARTYDELELGSTTFMGLNGRLVGSDFEGEVIRKELREGAVTTFGASVLNGGGRDVEIIGVAAAEEPDDPRERDFRLTPAGVRMNPSDGPGTATRMVPFRPFELRAGRERYLQIDLRMPAFSAYVPGGATGLSSFDVRYRTLIFERERTIELREPIEVVRGRRCS